MASTDIELAHIDGESAERTVLPKWQRVLGIQEGAKIIDKEGNVHVCEHEHLAALANDTAQPLNPELLAYSDLVVDRKPRLTKNVRDVIIAGSLVGATLLVGIVLVARLLTHGSIGVSHAAKALVNALRLMLVTEADEQDRHKEIHTRRMARSDNLGRSGRKWEESSVISIISYHILNDDASMNQNHDSQLV